MRPKRAKLLSHREERSVARAAFDALRPAGRRPVGVSLPLTSERSAPIILSTPERSASWLARKPMSCKARSTC
jgi:hypothetical protein